MHITDATPARRAPRFRPAAGAALLASVLALSLGACSRTALQDVTGSIGGDTALPRGDGALRQFAEEWGRRYEVDRNDKRKAITYARALRALGQHAQAVAVLQGLAIRHPRDQEVLGAYGKALAEAGQFRQASEVLQNAHTPERPNWSILSAQGTVADKLGDHAQAQRYYAAALKIRPGDPTILSNYGLSYALARNLPQAEVTLREAAASPAADMRVRQNLALVLALEGKFGEAEDWSRRDLSPDEATANVAGIRRMIAQSNTWRDIRNVDRKAARGATKPTAPVIAGNAHDG